MERRDFIRIVTSVFTSNALLMTMTTSARGGRLVMHGDNASILEGDGTGSQEGTASPESEKVDVSNNGSILVLDISGKPGRYVVILYKLTDMKGAEHTLIQKIDRIRKPGVVSIAVDLAKGLDRDIPFMVVTSGTPDFNGNNRGTDWFSVRISSSQPERGNLPQNHATVYEGEHQKVVRYGISNIQRRSIASLKRL